jgi:hypothetical protein
VNARVSVTLALLSSWCAACGGELEERAAQVGRKTAALTGTLLWEQKTPSVQPPSRMAHALVYDPVRQVTVVAGGMNVSDSGNSLSDTWSWDGESWSVQTAGLPNRGYVAGTFDSARGLTVLYGGIDHPQFSSRRYFAEALERTEGTWTTRAGTPEARGTTALAYDSARGVTVLFGGWTGSAWLDDVWEYDGTTWTRRCTTAPCSTSPRPSVRESAVLVYDEARGVTLLFGGYGNSQYRGDTWTWNGSAWTLHSLPVAPSGRTRAAGAYDPATQTIFLFGGATASDELDDLWAWNGSAWEEVAASTPLSGRRDLGMVWDTARRRGVIYGGRSNSQAVDFWEFSLVGSDCASDSECHNGVCAGAVCGDPPPVPEAGPSAPDAATDAGSAGAGGSGGGGSVGQPDADVGVPPVEPSATGGTGASDVPSAPARGTTSLYACSSSPARGSPPAALAAAAFAALCIALRRRRSA